METTLAVLGDDRRSSDQARNMTAILLLTFTFLILANVAVIVRLFCCYAPRIIEALVAQLTATEQRTALPAPIRKDVAIHVPTDFHQRLAQYLSCTEADLAQHRALSRSRMPFWSAATNFNGLTPKSSRHIRFLLIQIRRLLGRSNR